jgi:co-chaperonin GroES (HSP10)
MGARKVKALGPWIVVEPIPPPETTEGGIYKPQGNAEDRLGYCQGIVKSVGPGKPKYVKGKGIVHEHSGLKEGDRAFFRGFIREANKTNPMELSDETCLIHQDDILGVFE